MELSINNLNGDGSGMSGEEPVEDTLTPDCFPWPQDDIPDAKPDEAWAAIDILQDRPFPSGPAQT